jgi:hypothetical protein
MTIHNALVRRMPPEFGSKSGYYLIPTRSACVQHTEEIVVKPEDDQNRDCQSVRNCCDENEREHNTYGKN